MILWIIFKLGVIFWIIFKLGVILWIIFKLGVILWIIFKLGVILWIIFKLGVILWIIFIRHGRGFSSVGTATRCGLVDLGIEPRGARFSVPSRPARRPTQPSVPWVLGSFPRGKKAGAWY